MRGAGQSGAASQARGHGRPVLCCESGAGLDLARSFRTLAPRNFTAHGAAGSAGSRGGAGRGGLQCPRGDPATGPVLLGPAAYTAVPGPLWVRAPVCGGARAQGCVPDCVAVSVGGVGVVERTSRAPAETRRPATRAAPVCRRRSLPGAARGLGSLSMGARLPCCPCNGMR